MKIDPNRSGTKPNDTDRTQEVMEEMGRYCAEHPRSPAAIRRPRVFIRGRNCVALLGSTLQDGIVGVGETIEGALRAFDVQYRNSLKDSRD